MLLPFKKKKDADDDTPAPVKSKIAELKNLHTFPPADFVPYYCHFNPHTLLTKNGELLQIIKISTKLSGLRYEGGDDAVITAREAIRQAIVDCVQTDTIAIWLHTARKRTPIQYQAQFQEPYAKKIQDRWQRVHRWQYQYYNEIYVVLMHDGQSALLSDVSHLKNIVLPKQNREFQNRYLDNACEELEQMTVAITEHIRSHYSVSRLGLVERTPPSDIASQQRPIVYSEPLEFINLLLNLRDEHVPLPQTDLSEALTSSKVTFGFNALETRSPAGKRRFAAILSLKQYREIPVDTLDQLLQMPCEFIVSQAFHFVPEAGYLKPYKDQKELFENSGDTFCIEASGIADMMASVQGKVTDFGQHQTTLMILADAFKQLDGEVSKMQTAFADLGLITIREDIKLEECYWSQLPANFVFLRRRDIINTSRIGGFCRLNRYPDGTSSGNPWGEAVTMFPTLVGSPYFFNFHFGNNGHTTLFDFNSFNDQVGDILLNFLLAQSRKFNGKTYIFDRRRSAELLLQKLGGQYHDFPALSPGAEHSQLRLNPFQLEDNKRNRSFLLAWLGLLISPDTGLADDDKTVLQSAIEEIYTKAPEERNFAAFMQYMLSENLALGRRFAKWHGEGPYAGIFSTASQDGLDTSALLHAFDMTRVAKHPDCNLPIFSYLLHRIVTSLDGKPTLIVLHDALDLLGNHFMAPRVESLLEMLKQNNAMVLFTGTKPFDFIAHPLASLILGNCATHLFIPDDIKQEYDMPGFGLTTYDAIQLMRMDRQKGHFLLKQNTETIALLANLKELDEFYSVFANDSKTLGAAVKFDDDGSDG